MEEGNARNETILDDADGSDALKADNAVVMGVASRVEMPRGMLAVDRYDSLDRRDSGEMARSECPKAGTDSDGAPHMYAGCELMALP